MDRVTFMESISGIQYPEMLVSFFDQFIALKSLVENYGEISVSEKTDTNISFNISFQNTEYKSKAISMIPTQVIVYNKPISVMINDLPDNQLNIILQ